MYKLRSLLCILIFSICLVACSKPTAPKTHKENSNPISSEQLAKEMALFLPTGAKWTSPKYGNNRTPFFVADLDGDQQEEGIGLFKQNHQMGIIIIKKEAQTWKKITQETFTGNHFQLGGAGDLTGDQTAEIVLSIEGETEFEATTKVLQWNKQKMIPILEQETTATVFDDLDQDQQTELILYQKEDMHTKAVLYEPHQQKLKVKDTKKIEGTIVMSYITVGRVQKNRLGIVADISIGAHSGKAGIFYIENSKLHDAFDYLDNEQNHRLYNVKSQDINHDGILDIAYTDMAMNTGTLSNAEQPTIYRWYNWKEENKLNLVYQQYEDYLLGLRITYPPEWRDKIQASLDPQTHAITFGIPLAQNKLTLLVIAEISAVKKSDWPSLKQNLDAYKSLGTFDYSVLYNQNDVVYITKIYNEKVAQQMNGTTTYLKAKQSGMIPTHSSLKQWVKIYREAQKDYLHLPEFP
ncbi:hypothetical protein [Shimazuella kribbensis]|uniref:hypothetical protein n=1 Tax=Shimazuella kribbensis TaxID=139808 RepID=UPI000424FE4A|nr:hypothetical protein [Shimazuella kribbensis]